MGLNPKIRTSIEIKGMDELKKLLRELETLCAEVERKAEKVRSTMLEINVKMQEATGGDQ